MTTASVDAVCDDMTYMASFRWLTVILDFCYLGLMTAQKRMNHKFPSERFDGFRSTMIVHLCSGLIVIYTGCFLHLQNAISPINKSEDSSMSRLYIYYILALSASISGGTALRVAPKVMGERRLTFPLYVLAASLNLFNAVNLFIHPTLQKAFLVWGSINTFVIVRVNMLLLTLAKIDWELAYTYGIIAAAGVTYPLTNQPYLVYYFGLVGPLAYAPFHEKACRFFGWETEDTLGGNVPAEKNITDTTKELRRKLHLSRKFSQSIIQYGTMMSTGNKDPMLESEPMEEPEDEDDLSIQDSIMSVQSSVTFLPHMIASSVRKSARVYTSKV